MKKAYWIGRVTKPRKAREVKIVMDELPEDSEEIGSLMVSATESAHIDAMIAEEMPLQHGNVPFDEAMSQRAWEGDFKIRFRGDWFPHG